MKIKFFVFLGSMLLPNAAWCQPPTPTADRVDFQRDVAPIFVRSCLGCHGPSKSKSGFRLDSANVALKGGDLGLAIVAGNSSRSPLINYVSGSDASIIMPPSGPRLSADEVAKLRTWIDQGANWPKSIALSKPFAKVPAVGWWSLKPLVRPSIPKLTVEDSKLSRNPVDAFVLAMLREKHLRPSPTADERTLARRLAFDLTGLAVTSQRNDAAGGGAVSTGEDLSLGQVGSMLPAKRYTQLVNQLLGSPRYGERWARHWLDVVHYGETHGYDKDKPRPNAWPYRDYVIRAFNSDKPYGQFVREQIAGDVLYPNSVDGVVAMGFIAAGPWDFIGHAELPETKIDGAIARHLDRDDMVANTMSTFVGMTVHCAQCHDHKFDPISQEEYYGLQAVFSALDRTERTYFDNPEVSRKATVLQSRLKTLRAEKSRLEALIENQGGKLFADLNVRLRAAKKSAEPPVKPQFGYHSAIEPRDDCVKWVQVDLGHAVEIDRIVIVGCHDDFNHIGAGFGFPKRFKIEASNNPNFTNEISMVADRTKVDVANPGVVPQSFPASRVRARYVRVTATKLATRMRDYHFALAELLVYDAAGKNLALNASVSALDSVDLAPRWLKSNLVDGYYFGLVDPAKLKTLADIQSERQHFLEATIAKETRVQLEGANRGIELAEMEVAKLPKPKLVYAGGIHRGSPPFVGTGASGGRPRPVAVLNRGDIKRPIRPAIPGTLGCTGRPAQFTLSNVNDESQRRVALANWLTDRENPLVWRTIVNRIWQYHFGRGLVDTPNDLGRMGQLPTHPELLDWLAVEFRDGGQSIKALHRLILDSHTYRQSSADNPANSKVDADNRYLWRGHRRKLEAEAIRDSILAAAGKLDLKMGGPSFVDFVVERPEHSPHYEYHLHDPEDARTHRRSIYRFLVRSKPEPLMAALDCADPSLAVEKRNNSVAPQQALALLNGQLATSMAKHFAARLQRESPDRLTQVRKAFAIALDREPSSAEQVALEKFATQHGLENMCRAVFNLNEFAFVD